MNYDFNAAEIFEMAEQIERNGANFYRKAAENISDPASKAFLIELAEMEDDHEKTFSSMKKELGGKETESNLFDPEGEAYGYLMALADIRVFFEKKADLSSIESILKEAITAEKDSIAFYLGMKELVPEASGRKRLGDIIKEEMKHIRLLSGKLAALKK